MNKIDKTVEAVHTHTHTHTHIISNRQIDRKEVNLDE